MTKIFIEPSKPFTGELFDENNEVKGVISLRGFELSLSDDDDGIDFFMPHVNYPKNDTYIITVLSPDEADLLADNLRRLAEQSRRVMNQV